MKTTDLASTATPIDRDFALLTEEQQRQATMFFDYFGNHVTWYYTELPEHYIPVPFNFNTPAFWKEQFSQQGFTCQRAHPWHIDESSGVFHYVFTFKK